MTDTERIRRLERQLGDALSDIEDLKRAAVQLLRSTAKKESVQSAVDDLQNSVQLIFKNTRIPNVTYKPGRRIRIE